MSSNPWEVSMQEHQMNMSQFSTMAPPGGKIDGATARGVLMKSNLPGQVLAQVWALADTDRDGMLDAREYSIAMRLTRNCLAGLQLPPSLPASLMTVPAGQPVGMPPMAPMSMSGPPMGAAPMMPPTMGGGSMANSYTPMPAQQSMTMPAMHASQPMTIGGGAGGMGMTNTMPPSGIPYGSPLSINSAPYGSTPPAAPSRPPPPPMPARPGSTVTTPSSFPGRQCGNWTIPHPQKLKYCQNFNNLDKQRVGFLTGQAGRNALGLSGLPTPILAHIWMLSDVNKDGRLSVDEYCVAMHLIDMKNAGYALPDSTPPELAAMCGLSRSANNSPMLEPGAPPAQKSPAPKTFEDKRLDNYNKGQQELERRRQILMEEENRRRAEVERREREEIEKRERERMERERQRELERQAEMERQRQLEEARLEVERKKAEEREAQRREQERLRMIEVEKMRVKEMQAQKQQETERNTQRQQRQKTLGFQLQALDEKSTDLDKDILAARDRIAEVTKEIEGMRDQRDEKMKRIQALQMENQQASIKAQEAAHQLLQMQSSNKDFVARKNELDALRKRREDSESALEAVKAKLVEAKQRAAAQRETTDTKKAESDAVHAKLEASRNEYKTALSLLAEVQQKALSALAEKDAEAARVAQEALSRQAEERRREEEAARAAMQQQRQQSFQENHAQNGFNTSLNSSSGNAALPSAEALGAAGETAKYRALYEFTARGADELSFQPGDIIHVFESHPGEPGWKAGQIRDKIGWFPAAFAEPIGRVPQNYQQPIQNMPPNVTPSASLDKIPEDAVLRTTTQALANAVINDAAGGVPDVSIICTCVAQFPWKARNDEDLSFAKGDVIEILEQQEMKWRGRKADGSSGWFPKSYVKQTQVSASQSVDHGSGSVTASSSRQGSVVAATVIATRQESISSQPQQHVTPSASTEFRQASAAGSIVSSRHSSIAAAIGGDWYVAVYDFEAAETTDLGLATGDYILVVEKTGEWWKGRINEREGIFPANYVQKHDGAPPPGSTSASAVQSPSKGSVATTPTAAAGGAPPVLLKARALADFEATAANQLSLRVGDEVAVREKSAAGWWEGEMTLADGSKKAGWFPGDYVTPITTSAAGTPGAVTATAVFDYEARQADELSFVTGDVIVVDDRTDAEWWTGHKPSAPTVHGLFPSSYVQLSTAPVSYAAPLELYELPPVELSAPSDVAPPSLYDFPPCQPDEVAASSSSTTYLYDSPPGESPPTEKYLRLVEELESTEERYLSDLILAKKLYYVTLLRVVPQSQLDAVFLNWDELVKVSRQMVTRLRSKEAIGQIFIGQIDSFAAFVAFCSRQQAAGDALEKLLEPPEARALYAQCCAYPQAKGMSMSYFLLVPLGRVTRYPLLIEKLLKETDESSANYQDLDTAYQLLRALVEEVNKAVTHVESVSMLCWCQQHVKCPSLNPPIEFTSLTRSLGARSMLHSGVLNKTRSGRQLVGLLFNDFLLLTTPDSSISEPDSFKITKASDTHLTLYKTPLLLQNLSVEQSKEDKLAFTLKYALTKNEELLIGVRCPTQNSHRLWTNQLQQAVDNCSITIAENNDKHKRSTIKSPKGRLLVEVMSTENIKSSTLGAPPHIVELSLGKSTETFEVDATKTDGIKVTTQFPFTSTTDGNFEFALYKMRKFAPDLLILERVQLPLRELVKEGAKHRGPISKRIPLRKSSKNIKGEAVVIKFVVQTFDSSGGL